MAGDWIKVRVDLVDDPDVIAIAEAVDLDLDTVVGKLIRVWIWVDRHCVDGYARGVTEAFLDSHVGVNQFAEAMEKVGWLSVNSRGISVPKFDRHFSKSAKSRALSKSRMKRHRYADGVTKPSPEKRREDDDDVNSISTPRNGCGEPESDSGDGEW